MYNYDFKNNDEFIVYEKSDGIIDINDKSYYVSVVITNKNILIFNNANRNNPLNGRGIHMMPEYLLELSIPLHEALDYYIDNSSSYIKYANNEIILWNIDLQKFM